MQSAALTADDVRQWLSKRLGETGRCIVTGPLHRRDNSLVFRAECTALPTAAAVKWCLQPRTLLIDSDDAAKQFEALRRAAAAMRPDTRYAVPRTYLLDRERALIAIEWIDGITITEAIRSWRRSAAAVGELLAQAGRWLRHFHCSHPLPDGSLDVEERLAQLMVYEDRPIAREPAFAAALASLRGSAAAAASVRLERSWTHGDFKTDNLIVSGQRLVGIDVKIRHENAIVYDPAQFINHLELALYHPGLWRLAPARARLIAAFLDGYGQSPRLLLPLTWMRLYLTLSAWDDTQARGLPWLRAAILAHCFRSVTARLSAQLRELCPP